MKRNIFILLIVTSILIVFSTLIFASGTIDVKDYIKGKLPSIFSFYLSSLEELDLYEKEFIDLLEKLPEEEQEYYAKEVYKNGFSLELLEKLKKGKTFEEPTLDRNKIKEKYEVTKEKDEESVVKTEEKPIESLPSLIKRIKPSVVIVFAYDNKGEFLQLGSGFFISQNGDIITNYHVLQGAGSAEIKTSDGKTYLITHIVAEAEKSDIIRLSVNIPSQYVYPLSLSKTTPEVGERIIVYGSPLGWENTVSDGIVSAIRDIPDFGKVIQITAPISPGSSGSPVLSMLGEVIGIATFQSIEGQNLNFAIPSEKITSLILTEENKISIIEEIFGQESKAKKVIPATDEAKIKSVINEFFWAFNDRNWSKAKSCCVYGSKMYYVVCEMEDFYDYVSSRPGIIIIDAYAEDILNVSIDRNYSKAYCYYSLSITVYDGDYEIDRNYGYLNLQKVGNSWKLISIGLQK